MAYAVFPPPLRIREKGEEIARTLGLPLEGMGRTKWNDGYVLCLSQGETFPKGISLILSPEDGRIEAIDVGFKWNPTEKARKFLEENLKIRLSSHPSGNRWQFLASAQ